MSEPDSVIEAARNAERDLWRHYGLAVTERFITVADPPMRVRTLECGTTSGEPLLFVQGGLGEAWGWAGLMANLSDFRCITLDRPGGGFSDGVDFLEVDVRGLAVDVLQGVLDAAGAPQAAIIANSMGGWWAFQLAMRVPERVSRMVMLGCPAVILDTSAPLPMRLMSARLLGRHLVKLMVPANPTKARDLPGFLGHPEQVGRSWPEVMAETVYRFGRLPHFQRSWCALLRRFFRLGGTNPEMRIGPDELRSVAHPTLFLWGSEDPFGSVHAGRDAATLMPSARVEVVGRGHLPWWDDPEQCARILRDFLVST